MQVLTAVSSVWVPSSQGKGNTLQISHPALHWFAFSTVVLLHIQKSETASCLMQVESLIKSNHSLGCTAAADVPTYFFFHSNFRWHHSSGHKWLMNRTHTLSVSLTLQLLHVAREKPIGETIVSSASGPSENMNGSPIIRIVSAAFY